ncbi:MAG: PorT family protein [Flavobacteriaceae bacterium]|nr:PorT family protein [Flavobacteriaceae bacterium]|tara:strand:- start:711 stop:1415 length:705 start_codon:yes stop_codon:yes gene_type:complete
MNKYFSVLIILFFCFNGLSQKKGVKVENLQNFDNKKIHFGYFIGLNQYNFKIDYKTNPNYTTQVEEELGLNIGLIGDLKINEHLNLRFEPGLHTNKGALKFNERSKFTQYSDTLRTIKSTYIHLPLLLKFSSKRIDNFRPYLIGGISTSFNLSSNQNSPEDNKNNVFRLKTNTLYYELGFGIDFYLQYFKFSPSIRGLFSLKNELVPDNDINSPWTGHIDKLNTRGVFINLTFH